MELKMYDKTYIRRCKMGHRNYSVDLVIFDEYLFIIVHLILFVYSLWSESHNQ